GDGIEAECQRPSGQRGEFDSLVAPHTGVGRLTAGVRRHEVVGDVFLEAVRETPYIERDVENIGHAAGVAGVLFRAAATRAGAQRARCGRQRQVHTDDVVTGVDHPCGRHRRVDAAAHRDEHPHCSVTPALAGAAWRARSTAAGSTASAASTSASVLVWPNDNRSEPRALAGSAPIASSTCDGWATPAVHAEPVEHSTPLASSSISSESPSQPRKVKCVLPGRRASPVAPLRYTSSIVDSTPSISRSRKICTRALLAARPSIATLAAAAIATAPATSGVPERTSRSCPPPCSSGTQLVSRRSSSAPTPVGPPNLWAATLIADSPLAAKSTGIWPTAWTASLCI